MKKWIRTANRHARFFRGSRRSKYGAGVELAGVLVQTYLDSDQGRPRLVVSIDLDDTCDELNANNRVPTLITIQGQQVFSG